MTTHGRDSQVPAFVKNRCNCVAMVEQTRFWFAGSGTGRQHCQTIPLFRGRNPLLPLPRLPSGVTDVRTLRVTAASRSGFFLSLEPSRRVSRHR